MSAAACIHGRAGQAEARGRQQHDFGVWCSGICDHVFALFRQLQYDDAQCVPGWNRRRSDASYLDSKLVCCSVRIWYVVGLSTSENRPLNNSDPRPASAVNSEVTAHCKLQ